MVRTALMLVIMLSALNGGAIRVEGAYVREVPPVMTNSAAYMTLHNDSDAPVALVRGTSTASKVVELHTHSRVDGMMQMHSVEKIVIPAKGSTELKPMGLHVMLIGLKAPLHAGDVTQLALMFDNDEEVHLEAPVRKVQLMKPTMPRCGAGKCGSGKCGK